MAKWREDGIEVAAAPRNERERFAQAMEQMEAGHGRSHSHGHRRDPETPPEAPGRPRTHTNAGARRRARQHIMGCGDRFSYFATQDCHLIAVHAFAWDGFGLLGMVSGCPPSSLLCAR